MISTYKSKTEKRKKEKKVDINLELHGELCISNKNIFFVALIIRIRKL